MGNRNSQKALSSRPYSPPYIMPARITIVMGVPLLAIAVVEFYFAYDSAESNTLNSWDDLSTKNKAIAMTNTGQFGTGCQMLGLAFVVFALYEPPIILDDH